MWIHLTTTTNQHCKVVSADDLWFISIKVLLFGFLQTKVLKFFFCKLTHTDEIDKKTCSNYKISYRKNIKKIKTI